MSLAGRLRRLLRRDVVLICLVIFIADLVTGILAPTFSLYARNLGASLTLIGVLGSLQGLTQLFTSMPIGLLSDMQGRKRVLVGGMLAWAAATLVYTLAPNALLLIPGRILVGVAGVATFSIGIAYIGDVVAPEERGLAFGAYSTAMGVGFTLGPLLGAAIDTRYGIAGSYLVGSLMALVGAAIAQWGLPVSPPHEEGVTARPVRIAGPEMWRMLANPGLLAATVGNFLTSVVFAGILTSFFPVYVALLQVSQPAINSMFAARAFASTLTRLPTGVLTTRLPSRLMISGALGAEAVIVLLMAQTEAVPLLLVLLVLEGIAFGMFLTAGQAFVVENSTPATRGAAIGVYSTGGSLGSTASPFILGLVADAWGIRSVFRICGVVILLGFLLVVFSTRRPEAKPGDEASLELAARAQPSPPR